MKFPKGNPRYKHLWKEVAGYLADKDAAPIVIVNWMDASFDSNESIVDRVGSNYRAGFIDSVVGFYLGVQDNCVLIADSVHYDSSIITQNYRHIWNIPIDMIINIRQIS